jgi:hypothetical protein
MDAVEERDEDEASPKDRQRSRLNSWVAITVALLATFMGICKIKDDNIVQAMQQEQAKSVDAWAWYQAKKTRLAIAQATADQFAIQEATAAPNLRAVIAPKTAAYKKQADKEQKEMADVEKQAQGHDREYDRLNFHDDQFDLADAQLALAISLLAITALTQKRWLFAVAMIPILFGVLMGLSGLLGWPLHPNILTRLLS